MLKNGYNRPSLESCCKAYYNWAYGECLVEGGAKVFPESDKFYVKDYNDKYCVQDCLTDGKTALSTCTNPGGTAEAWHTKYKDAKTCCKNKLWWESQATCIANSIDPTASVTYVGSKHWYSARDGKDCVQDCATSAGSHCTPTEGTWQIKHDTLDKCCKANFSWLEEDSDNCKTARYYTNP